MAISSFVIIYQCFFYGESVRDFADLGEWFARMGLKKKIWWDHNEWKIGDKHYKEFG